MNDAIYKFKRYEDSSLSYTGINKHAGEAIGLFDTVLSNYDYLYMQQQESLVKPIKSEPRANAKVIDSKVIIIQPKDNSNVASKPSSTVKLENKPNYTNHLVNKTPKIELSKEKLNKIGVGTIVRHESFGNGIVVFRDTDYIKVVFDNGGEKKFRFPDAFTQGFIQLNNE